MPVVCSFYTYRVASFQEYLEYLKISLNMENSGENHHGILSNVTEKL